MTLTLLLLIGCKKVEDTPPDLDTLLHELWASWASQDDLTPLAIDLADLIDEEALLTKEQRGNPSRLTRDEIGPLDLDGDPDPALARGISLLNRFHCADVELLAEILTYPDQDAIYGDYDAYSRTFHEPRDTFLAGDADTLTWTAEASASNFATGAYSQVLEGGVRRVALIDEHPFTTNAILLARTYIPRPADTERDNVSFDQDYQIEAYLPWADGDVIHVYAIWRQIEMGSLGDMESDVVANVTMQNLIGWDRKTAATCADGLP